MTDQSSLLVWTWLVQLKCLWPPKKINKYGNIITVKPFSQCRNPPYASCMHFLTCFSLCILHLPHTHWSLNMFYQIVCRCEGQPHISFWSNGYFIPSVTHITLLVPQIPFSHCPVKVTETKAPLSLWEILMSGQILNLAATPFSWNT